MCCEQEDKTKGLLGWLPRPRPLFAVWPQQRYLPARVRALLDYLQAFIETEPIFGSMSGPARTA